MSNKQHIIVTGGAGFIGSHLTSRLLLEGYKVTILDNLFTGKEENIPQGADFIKIDLGEQTAYVDLEKINGNAIFHLAGQSSGEASFIDPFYDFKSHVMSTFWLLEWCKKKAIPRFIYASSMSVYGDAKYLPVDENHPFQPKTFYAAGKLAAEAYIRLYQNLGINTTIFRLFSVYGPGQNLDNKMQGMVSIYLSYILENKPIIVKGSSERYRDFIYIDDVVDVFIASLNNSLTNGSIYNVAGGVKTEVKELLEVLKSAFGLTDYPIHYQEGTSGDQFGIVANIQRINQDLQWQPKVDLQTGLEKIVAFEKERLKGGPKSCMSSL